MVGNLYLCGIEEGLIIFKLNRIYRRTLVVLCGPSIYRVVLGLGYCTTNELILCQIRNGAWRSKDSFLFA